MSNQDPPPDFEKKSTRELLFHRRLAERQLKHDQFPWNMPDAPQFEIPKEQTKLFADRFIEDPSLSDEEVERRALLDLTSFNFWTFFKRLNYEFRRAQRYNRALSVLLVSIDGLQELARIHGVHAENAVVLATGKLLLSSVRDVDIAGRCRDDTFGVILPETPEEGAEVAAERIRTKMERQGIQFGMEKFIITVSIGGSSLPGPYDRVDLLFGEAVRAVQRSLTGGGNLVSFANK